MPAATATITISLFMLNSPDQKLLRKPYEEHSQAYGRASPAG